MRRMVPAAAIAAALTAGLALTGCSGSSGGVASDSAAGKAARPAVAGGGSFTGPEAAAGAPGSAGTGRDSGAVTLTSRALVRTASLTVRVAKPAAVGRQADAADAIAVAAGGSVYADDRTSGKHATARLTLKVPPAQLSSVVDQLAALGQPTARKSSTEDVTTQVVDVTSRVKSAQASLDRLRALYGQANKVRDVIAIENEITARESDLESLQAQQRTLAGETDLAAVHLTLTVAGAPPPVEHARTGFLGGLEHGWHAFTASVRALVTVVGAALPFGVVLLILAAIGWRVRRSVRRGGRSRTGPPEPSAAE